MWPYFDGVFWVNYCHILTHGVTLWSHDPPDLGKMRKICKKMAGGGASTSTAGGGGQIHRGGLGFHTIGITNKDPLLMQQKKPEMSWTMVPCVFRRKWAAAVPNSSPNATYPMHCLSLWDLRKYKVAIQKERREIIPNANLKIFDLAMYSSLFSMANPIQNLNLLI